MKRLIVCWVHFGQLVLLQLLKTQGGTQDKRQEGRFGELQSVYKNIYSEDERACYTWRQ